MKQEEVRSFPDFSAEIFSEGKSLHKNDDSWVVTSDYLAVIDGSTSKSELLFDGLSGGSFASKHIADMLKGLEPGLYGKELIKTISFKFGNIIDGLGISKELKETPFAKPTALLTVATLLKDEIVFTQLGDVNFRINGKKVYRGRVELDELNATTRIEAINRAKIQNPDISASELMAVGRKAIKDSLEKEVSVYQNNPSHPMGMGALDGGEVPEKFIKTYEFTRSEVTFFEIFSDGYFKIAGKPDIASWEKAFEEVEAEDPYKINKYPSTKGSTDEVLTDDRTVIIVRFN